MNIYANAYSIYTILYAYIQVLAKYPGSLGVIFGHHSGDVQENVISNVMRYSVYMYTLCMYVYRYSVHVYTLYTVGRIEYMLSMVCICVCMMTSLLCTLYCVCFP